MKKMLQKKLTGKPREIVISTLNTIADGAKLSNQDKARFIKFAIGWYNSEGQRLWADPSYGLEWANRFKRKEEYGYSDWENLATLVKVDGKSDAISRLAKQIRPYKNLPVTSPKNEHVLAEATTTIQTALRKGR
ncbi:MAG: hypothetical protein WC372_12600 [Candidatus Neomarinimicrobiota bacterium]|jgi:hypothetical protein